MKLSLIIAATLFVTAFVRGASAQEQPWLQDRRYGEGIGIRTGDFELHPGVAAEVAYDSNYFLRSGDADEEAINTLRLRLTPSISLSTLGDQRRQAVAAGSPPALKLRASLWASYNEVVATDGAYSELAADQRHLDIGAGVQADFAPQKPVGGDVFADYVRTAEPSNVGIADVAFDRGTARGGGGLSWRPGGGLFEWRLGYELKFSYFEDRDYAVYNNFQQSIVTRGRWRFLPRTAILYDAQYTFVRYLYARTPQNNGDFVEARAGLSGLVTNRFAFLALIGWNSSYYVDNGIHVAQNYDGFVAHAELKWFLQPTPTGQSATVGLSSIAVGYLRNFSNSYLGSFYIRDRGYANFNYFMGGVVLLGIEAGLSQYNYPESQFRNGLNQSQIVTNSAFAETRVDARFFGEYRFSNTLAANTTLIYDQQVVGAGLGVPNRDPDSDGTARENIDYSRWQLWLGMRWFM
jgi:hypothetical protein